MRKIIHVDMDAYYAAIEIREDPSLRGKCVIVGGSPNGRGVVCTCSYETRKYGVRSGMSSRQAWQLCPQGVFINSNFGLYRQVSKQIREIFRSYTDKVETLSLDEAYLDVTENKVACSDAIKIARSIKSDILKSTRLTCSAGVSFNKFLAKLASEMEKPDGLYQITSENARDILFALPIEKFHGIGKVTATRMKKLGIHNGEDLYNMELAELVRHFGKVGNYFHQVVRGIDEREVISEADPKSLSCERTFRTDLSSIDEIMEYLQALVERLSSRMTARNIQTQNIGIKIKYDNFQCITRSGTLSAPSSDAELLFKFAQRLLVENWDENRKIRLLGVGVDRLDFSSSPNEEQLEIPF